MSTFQTNQQVSDASDGEHSSSSVKDRDLSVSSVSTAGEWEGVEHAYNTSSPTASIDVPSDMLDTVPQPSQDAGLDEAIFAIEGLKKLGIKVRDFAYESTLPPLSSVPQFVGGPRPLKRERDTYDDQDDPFSAPYESVNGATYGVPKKAKGLARELTEPVAPQPLPNLTSLTRHGGGYIDIRQSLSSLSVDNNPSVTQPTTPQHRAFHRSPLAQPPLEAPDFLFASQRDQESQDTDAWIDTPLATPNGSFQWRITDTSALPASQLDTESQQPMMEDVTLSQLGFTPDASQQHSQDAYDGAPAVASSSRSSFTPSPSRLGWTVESPQRPSHVFSPSPLVASPLQPSRYHLRDRVNPPILPASLPRPHSRSRDQRSTSLSPRRPPSRLRTSRAKGKRTSQSAQPVRRSARNAQKGLDSTILS